jgi:threonine dehydratase
VAIGGGGLISGVATAIKALRPRARVIGVEPVGAPTLTESLRAGRLVELASIETEVGVLAPRRSERITFDIIRALVDDIVLVEDAEMREAARWLWRETGVAAELAGAAAVAALRGGKAVDGAATVCALVCGAGGDGLDAPAPDS